MVIEMKYFPSMNNIVQAIENGIINAKNNYTFWTANKIQLLDADDNFLTIHVAQEISKLQNSPEIFMYANISDILKCSLNTREEYKYFMKKHLLAQDTLSLTLDKRFIHETNNDSVSVGVINIKNNVLNTKEEYTNDIEQLCKILQRKNKNNSTLNFAIFAFYLEISSNARIDANQRVENINKSFDKVVMKYSNLKSNFKGGDVNTIKNQGEWCVGCYVIEPNI
jgi:hypothetical protein